MDIDTTAAALLAALEALIPPPATSYHGINRDCPAFQYFGKPCPGHPVPEEPKITAARAAMKVISSRLIAASMMREAVMKIHATTSDASMTYPQLVAEISLIATQAIRRDKERN